MYDVITVGSATRDVFLLSKQFQLLPSERFETGVGECVALGTKVELDQVVHATGGGATNAAATFVRLGFRVAAACRVGDDAAGRDVLDALEAEGVDASIVARVRGGDTAYSALLTAATGERTALVHRGVSATFSDRDLPWRALDARWYYVTSLGGNLALARRLATRASHANAGFAWNPGAKEIDAGLVALRPIIRHARVLILNREEAARLTGARDVPAMLAAFASPETAIAITDGPAGAYASRGGLTLYSPGTGKTAISQTGAGDAFGSAFAASLMKRDDLASALALGILNAESVIGHIGAKAGILKKWPSKKVIDGIKVKEIMG